MNFRKIIGCLMFFMVAFAIRAGDFNCEVCGKVLWGRWNYLFDRVEYKWKPACESCMQIKERCFICGMPAKGAIDSESEAKGICQGVKDDLDRLFSRFLTIPANGLQLSIVERFQLENFSRASGQEADCVSTYGTTRSVRLVDGKFLHVVKILSYLQKPKLMAVCAHEYTHMWVNENVAYPRRGLLDKNTHEAFCELVAYKYMESLHEQAEMDYIKNNTYTCGQIQVLLAADSQYGFNSIVEWMKNGEDYRIDMAKLDRVRFVKDSSPAPRPVTTAALLSFPTAIPSPVPNVLTLKGISGTGQRRFALINNTTLETMERGRVRVGQTNIMVRCLEIRDKSVVIEVPDSKEKKELFLTVK